MGGFAQAITQGIGRAGSEYGEAREYLREQKQTEAANRLKMLQAALGMMELQRRIKQSGIQQYRGTFTDERGNVHAITTDPETGQPADKILYQSGAKYPDFRTLQEMESYAITHQDEGLLKQAQDAIKATQREPATKASEFDEWREQFFKSHNRYPNDAEIYRWHHQPHVAAGAAPEVPDKTLKALADKWNKEGIKPPTKYQAAVEQYMEEHNMQVKVKLSPTEQRLLDLSNQMEPKVSQLKKAIEDAGLTNDNSFVFSSHSALMQHLRFYGQYKRGVDPEKFSSNLIKDAAALQVMGAGPWVQLGRGKYMYETIVQHLPSPTDTPALLYSKAQFLQGIVDEARSSLPHTEGDLNELNDLFNPDKLVPK